MCQIQSFFGIPGFLVTLTHAKKYVRIEADLRIRLNQSVKEQIITYCIVCECKLLYYYPSLQVM